MYPLPPLMKSKTLVLLLGLFPFGLFPFGLSAQPVAGDAARDGLSEQVLYQFLLAEIAGQRGQIKLATDAHLDLARRTRDVRLARRATEIALHANMREQARQAAGLWLELEPESIKALQSWISLLAAEGRLAEVRPYLKRYLDARVGQTGPALLQLQALFARHPDKMAVLDLFTELAAEHAGAAEAQFALAQAAWNAERADRTEQALDQALRLRPGWETAALFKGQVLERQDAARAAEFWRDFLAQHPDARELRLAYAKLLARSGRHVEARGEFERLLKVAADNPEMHLAVGLLAMQGGDTEAAERYLNAAIELKHPDESQVRVYLGQLEEGRQRYEAALGWYQGVKPGPRYLPAQLQAALVLGKLGRVAEARALLKALSPVNAQERLSIVQAEALVLREAGDHVGVFELYSAALAEQPGSIELRYDRAMAAEKLGRLELLEQDLREIIRVKPDHAHAYNALGYTLADRTQRIGEALELVRKAIALSPDDPFILDSMGWALFKAGQLPEAVDYLRRAYALRPDPEIAAHLGEALWVQSSKDEARSIWRGALEAHPDNEVLRETVSRLQP